MSDLANPSPDATSGRALNATFSLSVGQAAAAFSLNADLCLDQGILVLFGPSGTGKSLTLSVLAGHLAPQTGRIVVAGRTLFDAPSGINTPAPDRRIGLVPQHDSLFPFRNVRANVAFGLPRGRRRNRDDAVEALMEEVGIAHLATASPASLSGGERQRVALARALAVQPQMLLLDEPFASIDERGRRALQDTLEKVLKRDGIPAVFVTHDREEARRMGDRIVLFERGRTSTQGRPKEVLGQNQRVTITGTLAEPGQSKPSEGLPQQDENGKLHTAHLTSATVTGPTDLLHTDEEGQIRIEVEVSSDG